MNNVMTDEQTTIETDAQVQTGDAPPVALAADTPGPAALDELLTRASLDATDAAATASAADVAAYNAILDRAVSPEPTDGQMLLILGRKIGKDIGDITRNTGFAVRELRLRARERQSEQWVADLADEVERLTREAEGLRKIVADNDGVSLARRLCFAMVASVVKNSQQTMLTALQAYFREHGWRGHFRAKGTWTRDAREGESVAPTKLATELYRELVIEDLRSATGRELLEQARLAAASPGMPPGLPIDPDTLSPTHVRL